MYGMMLKTKLSRKDETARMMDISASKILVETRNGGFSPIVEGRVMSYVSQDKDDMRLIKVFRNHIEVITDNKKLSPFGESALAKRKWQFTCKYFKELVPAEEAYFYIQVEDDLHQLRRFPIINGNRDNGYVETVQQVDYEFERLGDVVVQVFSQRFEMTDMYERGCDEDLLHLTAPHSGNESYVYKRAQIDGSVKNQYDMIFSRTGRFSEEIPVDKSNNTQYKFNSFPFYCVGRSCIYLSAYLGHEDETLDDGQGRKHGYIHIATYMSNEPIGPGIVKKMPEGYMSQGLMNRKSYVGCDWSFSCFPFAIGSVTENASGEVVFRISNANFARGVKYDGSFNTITTTDQGNDMKITSGSYPVFTIQTQYYWSDTKHRRTDLRSYRLIFDRVETRFAARIRY